MSRKHTLLAVVLTVMMITVAGCSGWGTDGPVDPDEETNGNAEAQEDAQESSNDSEGDSTSSSESSQNDSDGSQSDTSSNGDSGDDSESNNTSESENTEDDDTEDSDDDEIQTADMRVYAEDKDDGGYIDDAEVTVENRDTGETYTGTTGPGSEFDGTYSNFQNLPLGTYQVTITADGYEEATNTVKLTESGRQPILQMENEQATIAFTVVDQFGEPVPNVEISVVGQEYPTVDIYTDSNGEAEFGAPVYGEWHYSVLAEGYQTVDVGDNIEVDGDMEETIQIEEETHMLWVTGTDTEQPVTIERHADGATTTKETGDAAQTSFEVYPGEYTVEIGDTSKSVSVPSETSISFG